MSIYAFDNLIESQKNSRSIIQIVSALNKGEIEIEKLTKRPLQI